MLFTLTESTKLRLYRFALAPWLLVGHGIPKLSHWLLGVESWGPHMSYVPKNPFSAVTAMIEFVGPILILIGFKVRASSFVVGIMLALSGFAGPFPWFHERVAVDGFQVPFALIPSKEMVWTYALAYFALTLFGKDDPIFSNGSKDG